MLSQQNSHQSLIPPSPCRTDNLFFDVLHFCLLAKKVVCLPDWNEQTSCE